MTLRRIWLGGGALTLVAALVFAVMIALGTSGAPDTAKADFATPTPTTGPKPASDGSLTGTTDVWVGLADASVALFDCISYTDHDATAAVGDLEPVKSALICNSDLDIGDANGAGNYTTSIPGEGTDATPNAGPPPPPPYTPSHVFKATGTYCPAAQVCIGQAADTLVTKLCVPSLGGSLGPNIVSVTTVTAAKASLATTATATTDIYGGQSNAVCDTFGTPVGTPAFAGLATFLRNPVTSGDGDVPWRAAAPGAGSNTDYDGDGCTDTAELDKDGRPKGCGDDPFNPGDSGTDMDNVTGDYDILVTILRADDADGPGGTPYAGGFFFACLAHIDHTNVGTTNDLSARVSCYIDTQGLTVNPQAAGSAGPCTAPGPPTIEKCGDGLAGGSPPRQPPVPAPAGGGAPESGIPNDSGAANCTTAQGADNDADTVADDGCPGTWGDINSKHTELTGNLDKTNNVMQLSGCFEDTDASGALGHVYARAKIDQYTNHGFVQVFSNQTLANCTGGTPSGAGGLAPLDAVRQNTALGNQSPLAASSNDGRDSDGDGCPNGRELSDNQNTGGLRDPTNPNDYFNPTHDHLNRVDDIIKVSGDFFEDYPAAVYNPDTDRSVVPGAQTWNLGSPNLQHRVNDIINAGNQFFHDCGGANTPSRYLQAIP